MIGPISIPQELSVASSTQGLLSGFANERVREIEFGAFAKAMESKHANLTRCECNAEAVAE